MSTPVLKMPDLKGIELPYMLRIYGVTDEMFDEMVDEDTKADLIDGVLIVHSPASVEHDDTVTFIASLLRLYASSKKLGLVLGASNALVRFTRGRRVAPDILFFASSRVPTPLPKELEGAPELVVEVLSESNRSYDLGEKRATYHSAGVREIWFIDRVANEVIVDRRRNGDYVEHRFTEGKVVSQVVDGFWVETSWLRAEPLPDALACLDEILER